MIYDILMVQNGNNFVLGLFPVSLYIFNQVAGESFSIKWSSTSLARFMIFYRQFLFLIESFQIGTSFRCVHEEQEAIVLVILISEKQILPSSVPVG